MGPHRFICQDNARRVRPLFISPFTEIFFESVFRLAPAPFLVLPLDYFSIDTHTRIVTYCVLRRQRWNTLPQKMSHFLLFFCCYEFHIFSKIKIAPPTENKLSAINGLEEWNQLPKKKREKEVFSVI